MAWDEFFGNGDAYPLATNVSVTDDTLTVDLSDGRTISAPLAWYPRLVHGRPEERASWRLIGRGENPLAGT